MFAELKFVQQQQPSCKQCAISVNTWLKNMYGKYMYNV